MPLPGLIDGTVPEQEPGTTLTPGLGVGSPSLATTATTGFLYIPTCAGTPTGVPTGITGMVPLVFDTTNHRLYTYEAAAWHYFGETA